MRNQYCNTSNCHPERVKRAEGSALVKNSKLRNLLQKDITYNSNNIRALNSRTTSLTLRRTERSLRMRCNFLNPKSQILNPNKGFTLIEVLIAVAVLAIALLAVTRVTSVAIRNSEYLQQKTVAHWVTMDTAANLEVGLTPVPAAGGQQTGETKMLGKTYPWIVSAENVSGQPMVRAEVKVYAPGKKQLLDTAYGYFPQTSGVSK